MVRVKREKRGKSVAAPDVQSVVNNFQSSKANMISQIKINRTTGDIS